MCHDTLLFASQAILSTYPSNGVNLCRKKSQMPSRCFLTVPFFVSFTSHLPPVLHRVPGLGSRACAEVGGGASRMGARAGGAAGLVDIRVGRSLAARCLEPPSPARPPMAPSDSIDGRALWLHQRKGRPIDLVHFLRARTATQAAAGSAGSAQESSTPTTEDKTRVGKEIGHRADRRGWCARGHERGDYVHGDEDPSAASTTTRAEQGRKCSVP
jgi:hypothetical protein